MDRFRTTSGTTRGSRNNNPGRGQSRYGAGPGGAEHGSYGKPAGRSYSGGCRPARDSYHADRKEEGKSYSSYKGFDSGKSSYQGSRASGKKKVNVPPKANKGYRKGAEKRYDDYRTDRGLDNPNLLIGRNPVMEAINAGRPIDRILMQKDGEGSIRMIAAKARDMGIQIQFVDKIALDKLSPGRPHQGIAAYVAAHEYSSVEDILAAAAAKGEDPFLVILDGLEDPHNLGAIMRSVDGAGAHGIIIPSRRSVNLTETVAKASAGAIEYVPVAKTVNLAQTIDDLKAKGIWVAAVDMDGTAYSDAQLKGPLAIVIGGEGAGVSRLVKEHCDFVVGIPMKGRVNSLNASNAAAVILYEASRQRDL